MAPGSQQTFLLRYKFTIAYTPTKTFHVQSLPDLHCFYVPESKARVEFYASRKQDYVWSTHM